MPRTPIQEEPESTVGRKPERVERPEGEEQRPARSGAAVRREEGDETEAGAAIGDRGRGEPPSVRGREE